MPWKECSVVEERLRFVARLLNGEAMTELFEQKPAPVKHLLCPQPRHPQRAKTVPSCP
jgi:hypothetical protein